MSVPGCLQALLLHNQLIRAAGYDHVGYVVEQEGDSFTLAFHEPQDAVGFCLQVTQSAEWLLPQLHRTAAGLVCPLDGES